MRPWVWREAVLSKRSTSVEGFTARVLTVVRRIPAGRVATYGDVARLAGRPRAARAVGNIMRTCRRPDVPCHRVIAAGGHLGGYDGRELLKRQLLVAEGVPMRGRRIAIAQCRYNWRAMSSAVRSTRVINDNGRQR